MSTNYNLFEEKGEPKWNRAEALLLTSLTPYRWARPNIYKLVSLFLDFNRPSATLEKTHGRRKKKRQLIMQKRSSRGFSVLTLPKKLREWSAIPDRERKRVPDDRVDVSKAGPQQAYSGFWRDQAALAE